jgi:hypothetical protein
MEIRQQTVDDGRWTVVYGLPSIVQSKIKKPRSFTSGLSNSNLLLFLLGFHFLLMRFDDRAGDMSRNRIIVIEIH